MNALNPLYHNFHLQFVMPEDTVKEIKQLDQKYGSFFDFAETQGEKPELDACTKASQSLTNVAFERIMPYFQLPPLLSMDFATFAGRYAQDVDSKSGRKDSNKTIAEVIKGFFDESKLEVDAKNEAQPTTPKMVKYLNDNPIGRAIALKLIYGAESNKSAICNSVKMQVPSDMDFKNAALVSIIPEAYDATVRLTAKACANIVIDAFSK